MATLMPLAKAGMVHLIVNVIPINFTTDTKRLTEDDAGHGCSQTKLLLAEFGAECYKSVDNDCITCSIENNEHIRTVRGQRLHCFEYSGKTCSS